MRSIISIERCLLKERADDPPRDNRGRDFFVEEYEAAGQVVAVVRANWNVHAACADAPGAYFDVDRGILG